jgi:ADP-ribosylglycohydrolase
MLGAIAGDVIGSVHEAAATKTKRFPLFTPDSCFTDDTVLTAAVAEVLLTGGDYTRVFHRYFRAYPDAGYGAQFKLWCELRQTEPYNSWGNGAAMRVSPVGLAFDRLEDVLAEAERSAAVTHNHPEGIRGAKAVAAAVYLARRRPEKSEIAGYVEAEFGYRLGVPAQGGSPHVPVRRVVRGDGAVGAAGVPRGGRVRGRRPQRHLARRGRGYPGLHRRGGGRGVLRGATGHHGRDARAARRPFAERGGPVRREVRG